VSEYPRVSRPKRPKSRHWPLLAADAQPGATTPWQPPTPSSRRATGRRQRSRQVAVACDMCPMVNNTLGVVRTDICSCWNVHRGAVQHKHDLKVARVVGRVRPAKSAGVKGQSRYGVVTLVL